MLDVGLTASKMSAQRGKLRCCLSLLMFRLPALGVQLPVEVVSLINAIAISGWFLLKVPLLVQLMA